MSLFHIGKHDQDLGPCLATLCPHCQKLSRFKLGRRSAAFILFGFPLFDFDENFQLVCGSCSFRKDLASEDLSAVLSAKSLFQQLETQIISPERYLEALNSLEFPAYRALCEEAASWACSVCREKVPATLNACWKCNSPRPGIAEATLAEDGPLPPLPNAVTRSPHPWE